MPLRAVDDSEGSNIQFSDLSKSENAIVYLRITESQEKGDGAVTLETSNIPKQFRYPEYEELDRHLT